MMNIPSFAIVFTAITCAFVSGIVVISEGKGGLLAVAYAAAGLVGGALMGGLSGAIVMPLLGSKQRPLAGVTGWLRLTLYGVLPFMVAIVAAAADGWVTIWSLKRFF